MNLQLQPHTAKYARAVCPPRVTITDRGRINWSRSAHEAMGRPTHVILFYDPVQKVIGIRAAHAELRYAYAVSKIGADQGGIIYALSLITKAQIDIEGTLRVSPARVDSSGTLLIPLTGATVTARPTPTTE